MANVVWIFILFNCAITFLFLTYRETFSVIKSSGIAGLLGGLILSLSFVSYVISMTETTVANVVFIISTQTIFLAVMGYFFLKEKISKVGLFSIFLAMSGIAIMVGDSLNQGSLSEIL